MSNGGQLTVQKGSVACFIKGNKYPFYEVNLLEVVFN